MAAVLDELVRDAALDQQRVPLGIVAPDFAARLVQEAVVAHPVRKVMRQPRAALRPVVVGAGPAHLGRAPVLPVPSPRACGDAAAVPDATARVAVNLLPGDLCATAVEPAPIRDGAVRERV